MSFFSIHFLHLYMYADRSSKTAEKSKDAQLTQAVGHRAPAYAAGSNSATPPQTTKLMAMPMPMPVITTAALLVEPRVFKRYLPHLHK